MVIVVNAGISNFRCENIYPSLNELSGTEKFFRKNIINGGFSSVEEYLDIQFRLLREDFVAHLREAIEKYRSEGQTKRLNIYKNVTITKETKKNNETTFKIEIPKLKDEDTKKFMQGSLLLFTNNKFTTIFLAKVLYKNQSGDSVTIGLLENGDLVKVGTPYTMAECSEYFDPYYQVLNALQNISTMNFPMENYIVKVDKSTVYIPKYLTHSHAYYTIGGRSYHVADIPKLTSVLGLNPAQIKAFTAALTQEFVVIQGPPGTGKTYLGVTIATTLIQNSHLWYRNSPLLVISQKNDSLDQFLEGLLPITERLVRVGGQSKSEKLQAYNLANERKGDGTLKKRGRQFYLKGMMEALVVGMTTSAAARWKKDLVKLGCPIVIVEEAAEVLEGHVVAALTEKCQHLILLGDHQQLQPLSADHNIGKKCQLEISLFERMVINKVQHYQLDIQHRMRPEISSLLRVKIYPFLLDHFSVLGRPAIQGLTRNIYFFDHKHLEETCDITTKKNIFEANFLVNLARYLILNGYKGDQIVILATYAAQVQELESLVKGKEFLHDVKISSLDGFQGQESDIVLLSLVRSDGIGFLAKENRVCVALSRAKNGFYMVGNMTLLTKRSKLWRSIQNSLRQQGALGTRLPLRCQRHSTMTEIAEINDFFKVHNGGCNQKCQVRLPCGHQCCLLCHSDVLKHECQNKCLKNSILQMRGGYKRDDLWRAPTNIPTFEYRYQREERPAFRSEKIQQLQIDTPSVTQRIVNALGSFVNYVIERFL